MTDKPEDKPEGTSATKAKSLKKVYRPAPPELEIDAESWKRTLEKGRAKERAEGASFPGGRPFLIPSSDDYDKESGKEPDDE